MAEFRIGNIEPKDAIRVLTRRTDIKQPTFSWLDAWQANHSKMFTVAKSAGFEVLNDIADAVDAALKNGTTFDEFTKTLDPILKDKGWWGRGAALDPETGLAVPDAQLGSLRRLRTIYDINLRMSYAAGRWASVQRNKSDLPFLRYVHTTAVHPRAEHLAWDGVTLPVDHPWWQTHYPPNGWGCKCGVISVTQTQFDRLNDEGKIVTDAPRTELVPFLNKRTGERLMVPKGIDPGFGYNAGTAFLETIAG